MNPYHERHQRKMNSENRRGYTPEELKARAEKVKFHAQKGLLPPLPERKPLAKPTEEPIPAV